MVAIKRMAHKHCAIRSIGKEVSIHRKVSSHPHVVSLLGSFRNRKYTFLVMEQLKGPDLLKLKEDRRMLSEGLVLHIMRQIFDALHFMHKNGFAHMDLKLENVMLAAPLGTCGNDRPDVRVVDMGLAMRAEPPRLISAKVSSGVRGTPGYAAPEMMLDMQRFAPSATDMWSAGTMMFELLTRKLPYSGYTFRDVADAVEENGEMEIFMMDSLALLSWETKYVLQSCLSVDPHHRMGALEAMETIDKALAKIGNIV